MLVESSKVNIIISPRYYWLSFELTSIRNHRYTGICLRIQEMIPYGDIQNDLSISFLLIFEVLSRLRVRSHRAFKYQFVCGWVRCECYVPHLKSSSLNVCISLKSWV